MALFRWRGTTSGAFNSGLNWVDENGAAYLVGRYPGSVALTYDDVIFDSALAVGANSMAGYDATGGELLQSFRVASDYTGNVGTASVYVKFAATDVHINGRSTNNIYVEGKVASVGLGNLVVTGGNVYLAGVMTGTYLYKGIITIKTGASIGSLIVSQITSQADVNCTIESGCTFSGSPACVSGKTISYSNAGGILIFGGTWTHQPSSGGVVPLIFAGKFIWNSGTMSAISIWGGTLDAGNSNVPRAMTTGIKMFGGTLDLADAAGSVTIGASYGIRMAGGKVNWLPGQRVATHL